MNEENYRNTKRHFVVVTECDEVIPSFEFSSFAMSYSKEINSTIVSGSQVTYSCNSSYEASAAGSLISTCQSDGTWNASFTCHPG